MSKGQVEGFINWGTLKILIGQNTTADEHKTAEENSKHVHTTHLRNQSNTLKMKYTMDLVIFYELCPAITSKLNVSNQTVPMVHGQQQLPSL